MTKVRYVGEYYKVVIQKGCVYDLLEVTEDGFYKVYSKRTGASALRRSLSCCKQPTLRIHQEKKSMFNIVLFGQTNGEILLVSLEAPKENKCKSHPLSPTAAASPDL